MTGVTGIASADGVAGLDAPVEVAEFTDPACPWAWGSEPKFQQLRAALGEQVRWRRVYGILFDDCDEPAPDPAAEAAWYHQELLEISTHTAAPCPAHLKWVAGSSWPASLACKAAEAEGADIADAVLRRLRETTFLDGEPADTPERVRRALEGLPGVDAAELARAAASPEMLEAVRRDWAETRSPCAEVREITTPGRHNGQAKPLGELPEDGYRYALPTLVFTGPAGRAVVPGWRPLSEYLDAARAARGPAESRVSSNKTL